MILRFILLLVCFLPDQIHAQGTFDRAVMDITSDLGLKLKEKNKTTIAVLYITDLNKSNTTVGKYLADLISVYLINNKSNFNVFDRENLSSIAEAKKLISEGYIDVDEAKMLGKLLSVDAIIIGNYTILSNSIKLTIKALDSSTGYAIAASMNNLPLDQDASSLLGISFVSEGSTTSKNINHGFNAPLNSKEQYNNPETVNQNCQSENTGDYCFCNTTSDNLLLSIGADGVALRFSPGQTQCLYNFKVNSYRYHIMGAKDYGQGRAIIYRVPENFVYVHDQGNFLIEKCKSKTYIIN